MVIFSFAVSLILAVIAVSFALRETPDAYLDTVTVNNIVKSFSNNWNNIKGGADRPSFEYNLDYAVIDNDGNLIAATRRGLNENINDAVRNRDTIVDVRVGGEIAGKVIFYNDAARIAERNKRTVVLLSAIIFIGTALIFTGYTAYLRITILRPFKKLKGFARHIAAGNLDIPLDMDKNNLFGAFTESFDLMREELKSAKKNERKAEQSKKELVASLSHDIKTPVASIKAVTEYMLFVTENEEDKEQLETINAKAEQINALITNMFHATLEELQALSVSVADIQSTAIPGLIINADYERRIKPFSIPSCIVSADLLRLQQVFDNIISNSYKYAGTDIEINACFEEQHLIIDITDFGKGVQEDELPLILNKFYRGKNTGTKGGYGLGLYISNYLLNMMSGDIRCENRPNGFSVRLMLRLA